MKRRQLEAREEVRDTPKSHLVLLQSLRAVAAGMVLLFHLYLWQIRYFPAVNWLPKGTFACEAGVDLFFVASGFIMMHITPLAHHSWRDQGIFLFRRFARIYPAYWTIALPLLMVWFVNPKLINSFEGNHVDIPASFLLYPAQYKPVLFVGWTLVYELSYYVIASFIFYFQGTTRLALMLAWLVVVATSNILHPIGYANPWINDLFFPLTIEFIGGMFLAYLLRRGFMRISPRTAFLIAIVAFSSLFIGGSLYGDFFGSRELPLRLAMYGVPSFFLVWIVLQMDIQGEWAWFRKLAPLGDRSYSLYLVHLPVIGLAYRLLAGPLAVLVRLEVFAVMLITVAAILVPVECLHRLIEKPSHEFARNLTSRRRGSKSGLEVRIPATSRN